MTANSPNKSEEETTIRLSNSNLTFVVRYPDENPVNAIGEITNVLSHIGIMDNIQQSSNLT